MSWGRRRVGRRSQGCQGFSQIPAGPTAPAPTKLLPLPPEPAACTPRAGLCSWVLAPAPARGHRVGPGPRTGAPSPPETWDQALTPPHTSQPQLSHAHLLRSISVQPLHQGSDPGCIRRDAQPPALLGGEPEWRQESGGEDRTGPPGNWSPIPPHCPGPSPGSCLARVVPPVLTPQPQYRDHTRGSGCNRTAGSCLGWASC